MKLIRSLYHFLGGIYFALILIATVALFVIAGTFIESMTQSHRYAALFTYDNPLFAALLWGFFINILFAATRRWPFQRKHIPFLITHWGLLMILAGVLAKHYYGLQGSMSMLEGTASHEIMETNTYAVAVDKKNGPSLKYPLEKKIGGSFDPEITGPEEDITLRLAEFYPHSTEHLATWVKGAHATIGGLRAMPLYDVMNDEEELPISGRTRFHHSEAQVWDLYALRTSEIEKTIAKLFSQHARLIVKNRSSQTVVGNFLLETILQEPIKLNDGTPIHADLSLQFSAIEGVLQPSLDVSIDVKHHMNIPLSGDQTLFNVNLTSPHLGNLPWSVDILRPPLFAIIEDEFEDVHLIAFDPHGKIWTKLFRKGNLDSLVAYEDGFEGYSARAELPFKAYGTGRQDREEALAYQLTAQFRQALADGAELSPPLKLLQQACDQAQLDFPETATAFLTHWNAGHAWLYSQSTPLPPQLQLVFSKINWKEAPSHTQQACEWVSRLFDQIDPELNQGDELLTILKKNHWPLLAALEAEVRNSDETTKKHSELTLLTLQLFAASEALPAVNSTPQNEMSPETKARLLSAYLRAYEIHLTGILPTPSEENMDELIHRYQAAKQLGTAVDKILENLTSSSRKQQSDFIAALPDDASTTKEIASAVDIFAGHLQNKEITDLTSPKQLAKAIEVYSPPQEAKQYPPSQQDLTAPQVILETAVIPMHKAIPPGKKLEDNFPKITLLVSKGQRAQKISLGYERAGSGLKWPVLNGEYLLRFQPQFKELPYRVRLRQARQINYANSFQPYSFESDLIITDRRTNTSVEKTISMNKVHETWDGYRFYLSSITPPNETAIKHVQIVVNYDPAKYWLTYPGAIILSCGILMLFIMRPYRRTKQ